MHQRSDHTNAKEVEAAAQEDPAPVAILGCSLGTWSSFEAQPWGQGRLHEAEPAPVDEICELGRSDQETGGHRQDDEHQDPCEFRCQHALHPSMLSSTETKAKALSKPNQIDKGMHVPGLDLPG